MSAPIGGVRRASAVEAVRGGLRQCLARVRPCPPRGSVRWATRLRWPRAGARWRRSRGREPGVRRKWRRRRALRHHRRSARVLPEATPARGEVTAQAGELAPRRTSPAWASRLCAPCAMLWTASRQAPMHCLMTYPRAVRRPRHHWPTTSARRCTRSSILMRRRATPGSARRPSCHRRCCHTRLPPRRQRASSRAWRWSLRCSARRRRWRASGWRAATRWRGTGSTACRCRAYRARRRPTLVSACSTRSCSCSTAAWRAVSAGGAGARLRPPRALPAAVTGSASRVASAS
mmetsp:Transcript_9401/g.29334  ORF Transcript_9401/g.29334 Transcript_9401/m.29334 type:complete len:290 (-) Transcript_9401:748-1617(-)